MKLGKVMFRRCLSVHRAGLYSHGKAWEGRPPPPQKADSPPPPLRSQTPSPLRRQTFLRRQVVPILLECILVASAQSVFTIYVVYVHVFVCQVNNSFLLIFSVLHISCVKLKRKRDELSSIISHG